MTAATPAPRVVVLAGGLSHERDVSLRSGRRVAEALRSTGAEVVLHDVDADLAATLRGLGPDLVWPLLHGATGEDGSVRDVLSLLGIRVLGTGARQSRIAWDKPIAKTVVARAGLATPEFVALVQARLADVLDDEQRTARLLRQQLETQLNRLDRQEENLLDLAADGDLPKSKIKVRLRKIAVEREEVQRRLGTVHEDLQAGAQVIIP